MKRTALALAVLLGATGCSHVSVNAPAAERGPLASARIEVHGDSLAAAVLAGFLIAASAEPRPQAPELDPDRSVLEHDCTKPLPESGGNLKCL